MYISAESHPSPLYPVAIVRAGSPRTGLPVLEATSESRKRPKAQRELTKDRTGK